MENITGYPKTKRRSLMYDNTSTENSTSTRFSPFFLLLFLLCARTRSKEALRKERDSSSEEETIEK